MYTEWRTPEEKEFFAWQSLLNDIYNSLSVLCQERNFDLISFVTSNTSRFEFIQAVFGIAWNKSLSYVKI